MSGDESREVKLQGELGSRNDVSYRLKEDIAVVVGIEDRYPHASYTPLGLKAGDWSEKGALDELRAKIIKLYDNLRLEHEERPLCSKEKGHLEHLERIVERKPYDPRTAPTLATAAR